MQWAYHISCGDRISPLLHMNTVTSKSQAWWEATLLHTVGVSQCLAAGCSSRHWCRYERWWTCLAISVRWPNEGNREKFHLPPPSPKFCCPIDKVPTYVQFISWLLQLVVKLESILRSTLFPFFYRSFFARLYITLDLVFAVGRSNHLHMQQYSIFELDWRCLKLLKRLLQQLHAITGLSRATSLIDRNPRIARIFI